MTYTDGMALFWWRAHIVYQTPADCRYFAVEPWAVVDSDLGSSLGILFAGAHHGE